MIKIFRNKINSHYWENRWESSGVDNFTFTNENIYPIKYANLVVKRGCKILEAGCGSGRLYFHFKEKGFNIKGFDQSKIAIKNILQKNKEADVHISSISKLKYRDNNFDVILAFGLYHNIENKKDLKKSFEETFRVLKNNGRLVASVRFDSFENKIIEKIVQKRSKNHMFDKFHRWHFTLQDLQIFLGSKMIIENVYYARNVSFLFKFNLFRTKELKTSVFDEAYARSNGFKLNWLGNILDNILHTLFPKYFSNLIVIIARKTDNG